MLVLLMLLTVVEEEEVKEEVLDVVSTIVEAVVVSATTIGVLVAGTIVEFFTEVTELTAAAEAVDTVGVNIKCEVSIVVSLVSEQGD